MARHHPVVSVNLMNNIPPPIPDFLRRPTPTTEETMPPDHLPKQPPAAPEAKTRQRTELPATLSDGTVLADLTIPQLLDKRAAWESDIALQEQRQLELRAIRAEIRRKA